MRRKARADAKPRRDPEGAAAAEWIGRQATIGAVVKPAIAGVPGTITR